MKHLLVFSLLVVAIFSAQAQFEIGPPVYPVMPNLQHLSVVDTDGDGDNELLTSAFIDTRIGTFDVDENGSRSFEILSSNLTTGEENYLSSDVLLPVDLDNDGDLDILALEYLLNRHVVWYENVNGEYERRLIQEAETGFGITHYDYDQDGDQDILYSTTDSEIVLYEQTSTGVFADPVAVFSIGPVRDFLWHDLDQDGDVDLISSGTHLAFYENIENVLQAPMDLSIPGNNLRELEVIDLNNDGLLDLVARDSATPVALRVYYQSEGMDFTTILSVNSNEDLLSWEYFDVNADGIKDFVIALETFGNEASLHYHMVDDQGQIGLEQPLELDGPMNLRRKLISGDINNDGVDELIASERDLIDVYQGSANGLVHMTEINGKLSSQKAWTADLNNDGLEDMLIDGNAYAMPEHIAFNDGAGGFLGDGPLTFASEDFQEFYPNLHDISNNGLTDVFLFEDWSGTGTILEQTGDGELVPLSYFSSDSWFFGVHSQFGDV
ncbi:MAG: FG-GAP repeat domain-containing protein, partial [Flavobacteriales bacterium]